MLFTCLKRLCAQSATVLTIFTHFNWKAAVDVAIAVGNKCIFNSHMWMQTTEIAIRIRFCVLFSSSSTRPIRNFSKLWGSIIFAIMCNSEKSRKTQWLLYSARWHQFRSFYSSKSLDDRIASDANLMSLCYCTDSLSSLTFTLLFPFQLVTSYCDRLPLIVQIIFIFRLRLCRA